MKSTTFTFTDHDNIEIFVYKWAPDSAPKAAVQISHGMAEHAKRYERFAQALTGAGFIVYANDHRGHGQTAKNKENLGKINPNGWDGLVKDLQQLTTIIKKENPGLPIFLFGHSMGSFLSQAYIQRGSADLKGVILSGSNGKQGLVGIGTFLAKKQVAGKGADAPGALMDKMSFGAFNSAFKPNKTTFDWLSRDEAEVQKYINDPFCGFICANHFFVELLGGFKSIWAPDNEAKIDVTLPIYLFSGGLDPVSNKGKGVQALYQRYQTLKVQDITFKLYPEGRHEMLNETNRDEVMADVIAWLNKHL